MEKYIYWLTEKEFFSLKRSLEAKKLLLYETPRAVCLPLSKKIQLGVVSPDAWQNFDLCKRQLSWYGTSEFAGLYLLVSSIEIKNYGMDFPPLLRLTMDKKFKPDTLPSPDDAVIQTLADNRRFQKMCPPEFHDTESLSTQAQDKWLRVMGIRGISYKALFGFQCANHANFIEPEFYVTSKDGVGVSPYSIGKTSRVCSACLEFYGIIGREFAVKHVVPCPGAVLFAGMSVNRYYRVETLGSPEP